MNKERRDHLRAVIGRARRAVEASLQKQANGYGLFADADPLAPEELSFSAAQQEVYPRLVDAVKRAGRAMGAGEKITPAAVERYVREAGGTWVNRLAALRALEARGLLAPAATLVSDEYGGLSPRAYILRERASAEGKTLSPDEALKEGLRAACAELSATVRVLFDLTDEQSLLWPDKVALRDLLGLLGGEITIEDWREPDVLGWVYQYYNTEANAALKKRKNKTTGFQYRPDDIPIANQFYTPSWVVRVLTDNTLGRLWLEAKGRLPRLVGTDGGGYTLEERRQGVPHAARSPGPFRAWIEETPDPIRDTTVDRLCRFLAPLPSEAPPRPAKSVRELRVLDPACGSGHFLLYAFDVLFTMYREAEPHLDPREIPALILEHNLYGIDIDLRAAQLAAFDLYLRARVALHAIDPGATLALRRLNIVVADAHIGDDPRRETLLERYREEPAIQELFRRILADVDHTNVLGSLLKVRPIVEKLFGRVSEARRRRAEAEHADWTSLGQQELIPRSPQLAIRDVFKGISGREFRIEDLLDDLRRFEEDVFPSQDIGARLFYTDVERTVGLISLLLQHYDVVLMNPPYGEMPPAAKDYLKGSPKKKIPARYPRTHGDLFAAFIEQTVDLAQPNGFVGALVPWTFFFLSSLEKLRTEILSGEARPELLQEYGYGILDGATVGTTGLVARKSQQGAADHDDHIAIFNRLSERRRDWEKRDRFIETFPKFVADGPSAHTDWFGARLGSLKNVPGMPYAYWASDWLRALFRRHPPLDRDQNGVLFGDRPDVKVADVKVGLQSSDDARFVRFHWEVPRTTIGAGQRWVPFVKGGTEVRFFARTDRVVTWQDDGREMKAWAGSLYNASHWSRIIKNVDWYFRSGITWPVASWRLRRFGMFPEGCIFSHKGSSIFPVTARPETILAVLNSALGTAAMLVQTPERMWEVGLVGNLPIAERAITEAALIDRVTPLVEGRLARHQGDETFSGFLGPDLRRLLLQTQEDARGSFDLLHLVEEVESERREREAEEARLISALDDAVHDLYGTPSEDRALIARELARRLRAEGVRADEEGDRAEGESEPEADEDSENPEPEAEESEAGSASDRRQLVASWISYYVRQVVETDDDGIVPVSAMNREAALVVRVREAIVRDLGAAAATQLEHLAPKFLGTDDLEVWLQTSREEVVTVDGRRKKLQVGFFPWQVERYRNHPPIWMISSENFESGKVRMTFRVLVDYHRLTPDTMRKIRSHYFEEIAAHAQAELDRARAQAPHAQAQGGKTADRAQALAQELTNTVSALGQFRAALERVIEGPAQAQSVAANARWIQRTIAEVRGGRDVGHGYVPNVDYGVKVNITPLAEARLLPRVVLSRLGG